MMKTVEKVIDGAVWYFLEDVPTKSKSYKISFFKKRGYITSNSSVFTFEKPLIDIFYNMVTIKAETCKDGDIVRYKDRIYQIEHNKIGQTVGVMLLHNNKGIVTGEKTLIYSYEEVDHLTDTIKDFDVMWTLFRLYS